MINLSDSRRNRRFRDIEFDIEGDRGRCLWGLNGPGPNDSLPRGVRRVTSMFNNPSFFAKPGQPGRHAIQGRLGNCWFLSAIATVGTVPRLIEQICVSVSRVDFSLCAIKLTFGHGETRKLAFMASSSTWTGAGSTLSLTSKLLLPLLQFAL
jgi:hypothetical protein